MKTKPNSGLHQNDGWSLFIRISHWFVAVAVLIDLFNGSGLWHRWIGYAALVMVLVRLLYGLYSGEHAARLWWPGVTHIQQHLNHIRHRSVHQCNSTIRAEHNALGQLAVYCMWGLIICLGLTGWLARTDAYWGEDWPVDLHGYLASGLQGMVLLHITAVLVMGRLLKQPLIRRMLMKEKV